MLRHHRWGEAMPHEARASCSWAPPEILVDPLATAEWACCSGSWKDAGLQEFLAKSHSNYEYAAGLVVYEAIQVHHRIRVIAGGPLYPWPRGLCGPLYRC